VFHEQYAYVCTNFWAEYLFRFSNFVIQFPYAFVVNIYRVNAKRSPIDCARACVSSDYVLKNATRVVVNCNVHRYGVRISATFRYGKISRAAKFGVRQRFSSDRIKRSERGARVFSHSTTVLARRNDVTVDKIAYILLLNKRPALLTPIYLSKRYAFTFCLKTKKKKSFPARR